MRAFRTAVLAAALAAIVAGCGSDDEDSGPTTGRLIETPTVVATVPRANLGAGARCDVRIVSINYDTLGARADERSNASGGVLVPTGADPVCQGPFPLLAYTRGTSVLRNTSMADPANGEVQGLMATFASAGYLVVATDYLGYAKSQYPFHPYLHSDSEATAAIDSIRAARSWASANNVPLSGRVMVYGFSQGGHSSLSTQRAIETQPAVAQEINLVAAGHGASPAALSTAMRTGQEILGGQFFIPFLITAWQKVYGDVYRNPSEVFTPAFAPTIENLLPAADPAALGVLPASGTPYNAVLFQPAFITSLQNGTSGVIRAAARNDLVASGWNPSTPTRFCAGSQDPTVIYATSQQAAIDRWGGLPNVSARDVHPDVVALAQQRGLSPTQTIGQYHGTLAPTICLQDMRAFFDARR